MEELLEDVALRSARYLADMRERGVAPSPAAVARLAELREAFPAGPSEPADVLALLDEIGSPATMGSAGPEVLRLRDRRVAARRRWPRTGSRRPGIRTLAFDRSTPAVSRAGSRRAGVDASTSSGCPTAARARS